MSKIWTVSDIQSAMTSAGSHWWSPDNMKVFGTRVCGPAFNGPGGVFFATSEKRWGDGKRVYSVRQYTPATNDLDTVGELGKYATRAAAVSNSRKLAGADDHRKESFQPIDDFDYFLAELTRHGCTANKAQVRELTRLGKRHQKYMEAHCNGREMYDANGEPFALLRRNRESITAAAKRIGCPGVIFSGDPRGCTVKLILPDGHTNDWGQEGFCVPVA